MAVNAVTLDGASTYLTVANFAAIDSLTDGTMTIEAWFNQDATGSAAYGCLIDMGDTSASTSWLETENATSSTGVNFGYKYSTTNADGYVGSGLWTNGNWFHLAAVYTTNSPTKVYVDGTEITYSLQRTPSGTVNSSTGDGFQIGKWWDAAGGYIKGYAGGFLRVWNTTRTGTEINDNKSLGLLSANETGLIVNVKFSEGSGTYSVNEASVGNNLVFTGSPVWTTGPTITEKSYTSNIPRIFGSEGLLAGEM